MSTRIRCGCFRFRFNHPHEYATAIYILLTTSKWACANRARDLISRHFQKWLIVVVKIAVLISMHATRLEISASKVENRRLLSAVLNLQVLFLVWTQVYDVLEFENVRFQSSTRIHKSVRIKKKSTQESGFKKMRFQRADSLVSCGRKADSYKKKCGFKNIRIRVDGASAETIERFSITFT